MAEFWVRNTTAASYTINDLGATFDAAEERDLFLHFYYDDIRRSEDLNTALSSGDLVRLDSEGGSIIPFANAYDDAVVAHNIAGDAHFGALSTDEVTEGPSNLYYTEGRVSANTDVAANTSHRGSTANPHSTDIGNLGTGTLAELNAAVTDATLDDSSDPRTPSAHASSHSDGGADEITLENLATSGAAGTIPRSDGAGGLVMEAAFAYHNQIVVDKDDSGDYTTIAAALTSITDAADDNRYIVLVGMGEFTEDITIPDYVYVRGRSTGAVVIGTVTFDSDNFAKLSDVKIQNTNSSCIEVDGTGQYYLSDCSVINTWTINTDKYAVNMAQGEITLSRNTLLLNVPVHNTALSGCSIYRMYGSSQALLRSYNCSHVILSSDRNDDTTCLTSTNTNSDTQAIIKNGFLYFLFSNTSHENDVAVFYQVAANHPCYIGYNDIDVALDAAGSLTSSFDIFTSFIYNTPGSSTAQMFLFANTWRLNNIADSNMNLAVAHQNGGTSTISIIQEEFIRQQDDFPEVGGGAVTSNGDVYYTIFNNFGTQTFSGALPNYANTLSVAKENGQFTSIKTAVDAAVTAGASASTPYTIAVYPGTYTESPMTIPAGIIVTAHPANRSDSVFVVASNSAEDLFTCTGGYICGVEVSGVSDAAKACFRMATANALTVLHGVAVKDCSTGVAISNGAKVVATDFSCNIDGAGIEVGTVLSITGANSYFGMVGGFFSVPSAVLPAYTVNPIQTVFRVADQAQVFITGATARVAAKDTTADVLLADGGSRTTVMSSEVSDSYRAARIGSSGTGTEVVVTGSAYFGNTINGQSDSSTGVFLVNAVSDEIKFTAVAGTKLSGFIQSVTDDRSVLAGDMSYQFNTFKRMDLELWFHDQSSTGIAYETGGFVTASTGLTVDVTAGEGWVSRHAPYHDTENVEWDAVTGLSLTASSTNYVGYDSVTEAITAVTSEPGVTTILLAIVETSGTAVRFVHQKRTLTHDVQGTLQSYLHTTRNILLKSGLAVTEGSTNVKIDVDSGSYYHSLDTITYAGATDATWSYFYGTNGATEVASQSSVDTTQYDNAGTLTNMTSGYWRSDTVILTSDGRISIIYGTAEYSTQALAEAAEVANKPTFIEESGIYLARLIVQQGDGIDAIVDERPIGATSGGGSTAITVHGDLSGLSADDHTQYLLTSGTRAMGGSLDMGANAITNVGNVDGVDVSDHSSRHQPGATDALSTGTPVAVQVGATAAEGTANTFARSDHQHGITVGTPTDVGDANATGSASTVARSDHVHAGLDRNANDFSTFTGKTALTSTDLFLIEDSADSGSKKKATFGDIEDDIDHLNIQNIGTNSHAQIDSHIGNTSNPHSVTKTQVGLGNVTNDAQVKKISSSTNDAIPRWDGTTGDLLQDSGVVIDDDDKTTWPDSGTSKLLVVDPPNDQVVIGPDSAAAGYRVSLYAPADTSGLFIKASDDIGTSPLHIEDDDGTIQVAHFIHSGELGLGTTTPTYGVDLQRTAGDEADFNTANGLYRIGAERANDAITAYDSLGNQSFTALTQINLDATTVSGNLYTLSADAITVGATGRYLISFQVSMDATGGRTSTECSLFRDTGGGLAEVTGTRCYGYHRNTTNGENTASCTVVLDLDSGDRLALGAEVLAGSAVDTIANASRLTIQRLS